MEDNFYATLEVSEGSSLSEIRNGFRKMALKWHPDKNKSPLANEMMKKVNKAYKELIKLKKDNKEHNDELDAEKDGEEHDDESNDSFFSDLFTHDYDDYDELSMKTMRKRKLV